MRSACVVSHSETSVSPINVMLSSKSVWDSLNPMLFKYKTNTTDKEP